MSKLFSPIKIGSLELKNRIIMSPMCQYSATDGFVNNWHFVHYATRAVGGCAAIIQEATAISPEGRISYGDLGIWKDEHIEGLLKITSFMNQYGALPGIQLAHAGRKASCDLPSHGGGQLKTGSNSWQTVAPSAVPFNNDDNAPIALSKEGIMNVISQFRTAAIRAIKAGYRILEIHAAHGYLIQEFLSPLTNKRDDEYGGTFENRIRFLLQIVDAIKEVCGAEQSLWVRITATDWVEGGWDIDDSVMLCGILKEKGVELVDVSTGGNVPHAHIPISPGYQVKFSDEIKKQTGCLTGAVGLITEAQQAENILSENKSDLIFFGRELIRNPYFAYKAAKELNAKIEVPAQYDRMF